MADNTELNLGSGGDVIATDDIGPGVKYQRVKLTLGADGVNDGDVASGNPLPISDNGGSLTVDGTVTIQDGGGSITIDASALPLPTGAASEATLAAIQGAQLPDGHNVTVDNASIAITAASLPLPTGAATEATLASILSGQLADGHNVTVDNANIPIANDNTVDSNNSTTTPLGGGAAFTGTGTDVSDYATVAITLYADQDSATDGMQFQFSTDNSNWDDSYDFNMSAGSTRRFQFPVCAQYFRVVFTNGATPQGALRIQTNP